jgi:hypothetical protein
MQIPVKKIKNFGQKMSLTWYHKNIKKTLCQCFCLLHKPFFIYLTNSGARGLLMEIAIMILLLVSGGMIYNYAYRKKMYREIDRLEAWKIAIMNRPITDELSKVKQLNMTGETEQLFERWRQQWDDIVATRLPAVEEKLFDVEEFLDKYRYTKAKGVLRDIE